MGDSQLYSIIYLIRKHRAHSRKQKNILMSFVGCPIPTFYKIYEVVSFLCIYFPHQNMLKTVKMNKMKHFIKKAIFATILNMKLSIMIKKLMFSVKW